MNKDSAIKLIYKMGIIAPIALTIFTVLFFTLLLKPSHISYKKAINKKNDATEMARQEGYEIEVIDNTYGIITSYLGKDGNVTIPGEINGFEVVKIDDNAFEGNNYIEKVTIPETIKTVGERAFCKCSNLKQIELKEGISEIGPYAFEYTNIERVDFPSTIAMIGDDAFEDNSNLKSVSFRDGKDPLSIGNRAFYGTSLEQVDFPATVASIGSFAFGGNNNLKNISFMESDIPLSIGVSAFEYYQGNEMRIPGNVTDIKTSICQNLEIIRIERCKIDGVTQNLNINVPLKEVHGTDTLTEIKGYIGETVFYGPSGSEMERFAKANGYEFIVEE